ncbi:MAG: YraN family protein, partial [Thermoanaerobaculia bacterium]
MPEWKAHLKKLGLGRGRASSRASTAALPGARASTRPAGVRGEALAADYLEARGVRVLARNYRAPGGEI